MLGFDYIEYTCSMILQQEHKLAPGPEPEKIPEPPSKEGELANS